MGAQETGRASSATGYLLKQRRWSVLSLLRDLRKWRSPLKRGGVLTKGAGAKKIIVLLVAMVVLVVSGVAYAANSYPAHSNTASNGGDHKEDHQGMDDTLLVDGLDGLLGRWLDPEDSGEQD